MRPRPYERKPNFEERFWSYVDQRPGECWLWKGGRSDKGYGVFGVGPGRSAYAHRVSYELVKGAIPEGLVLDHLCRTPLCVNPDHLDPVTQAENMRRSPLWGAPKDVCKHGHPFTEANTYWRPDGKRACRACGRRAAKEYQRRKRGLATSG